jgi:hypothetical protein
VPLSAGGVVPYPEAGAPPATDSDAGRPTTGPNGRPIVWTAPPPETVVPTAAEMHMVVTASFSVMDKDRSGFIEVAVTPVEGTATIEQKSYNRDDDGRIHETGEVRRVSAEQARAEFIARGDTDHDGKWSFDEYREWMKPHLAKNGIPASWREDIENHY